VTPAPVAPNDQLLAIGGARTRLPATSPLPGLRREHRLYDRFMSSLGTVLDAGDAVVVAGAGWGTSLAALADARAGLHLLAIERDAARFAYLRANATGLPTAGTQLLQAELGTPALPGVDAVLREAGLDGIRLLVSTIGTQGPDILAGASDLCAHVTPMLYLSCQVGGDPQGADAWRQRLRALWSFGYSGFWLFDNFGNPICEATQPRVLDQMLDYLHRQNQRRASRTLYYFDVLAFGERDAARAQRAVELHTR
jgi:hypothetical protein